MTYGQIRVVISKQHPGVDLELIDNWFQTRYQDYVLQGTSWKRQEGESIIQVPDSYSTGTVSVSRGSTALVGVGTTFTAAMTGLMIRIDNQETYYQFTYVSATTGTLDRALEDPTVSGVGFRIDQPVFLLPSACRVLRGVRPLHNVLWNGKGLERLTPAELNAIAPTRSTYGTPAFYAPTWDSQSDPPQMQVELYPIPASPDSSGATLSFAVDCIFDSTAIDPTVTSQNLLPWVSDGAMVEGVSADILRWRAGLSPKEDLYHPNGIMVANEHEARFNSLLKNMGVVNAQQRGQGRMKLAEQFVGRKAPFYRRGPKHEGWPG